MSIINQMLLDLDKRRASGAERGALPNQVRALPRSSRPPYPWRSMAIVTGAFMIALVGWQLGRQPGLASFSWRSAELPASVESPVVASVSPTPPRGAEKIVQPTAAPLPAMAEAPAVKSAAIQPQPQDRASRAKNPPDAERPRSRQTAPQPSAVNAPLATASVLSAMPQRVDAAPKSEAAKQVAPALAAPTEPRIAPPTVASAPPKPAATSPRNDADVKSKLGSGQIDKRSQELTARDIAENEYRAGATLLSQGRSAEAQEKFRAALQEFPAHSGARQGLFGLLVGAKRTTEAEQLLHEGLRANPNQPGFAMALARMQVDRGDTPAGLETLQKTAGFAQGSADYLAFMAALQQRQSRHAEAVENYHAALKLAPQSGIWWMGLGISMQALSRNAEAQDAFRRAKGSNMLSGELQAFVDQRLKQLQ